jgi:adenylate cyclase
VESVSVPEQVEAHLWGVPPSLNAAQVAVEIGRDEAAVRRVWRLLGFSDPEARVQFFPEDVELLRVQSDGETFFGSENVDHMTRAVGAGCRAIMEAAVALLPDSFGDVSELPPEEAQFLADTAGALLARMVDVLPALLRHQGRETLWFRATGTGIGLIERTMAVAFCDLVGSTQMANESPTVTGQAIRAFETFAAEEIAQRGGRLIKFVGDEVMFATDELDQANDIALVLVQWVASHDHFSQARAGIARGPVISRNGDLYGPTVNLASRLAGVAEPDTIVMADDTAGTTVAVRGFADPVHVRTTRTS